MKARLLALMLSAAVVFAGIPTTDVWATSPELETNVGEEIFEETSVGETSAEETALEDMTGETAEEEAATEEIGGETAEKERSSEELDEEEAEEEAVTEETEEEASEEKAVTEETGEEEAEEETVTVATSEEATEKVVAEETGTAENAKLSTGLYAVGSNGIEYEGVAYLSEKTFHKLPREAQDAYIQICDSIEEYKEKGLEIEDAVISVDKNLVCLFFSCITRGESIKAVVGHFTAFTYEKVKAFFEGFKQIVKILYVNLANGSEFLDIIIRKRIEFVGTESGHYSSISIRFMVAQVVDWVIGCRN